MSLTATQIKKLNEKHAEIMRLAFAEIEQRANEEMKQLAAKLTIAFALEFKELEAKNEPNK
jgi:hypothetical protein